MRHYWEVPEDWPGATAVCIGNGPSLTQEQVDCTRDARDANGRRVRVIAINDAFKMAPWADVLYFCDDKWWQWRNKQLTHWQGLIVRLQGGEHDFNDKRIKVLRNLDEKRGLAVRRDGLHHGQNSGYQALHLAVHFGAKRILLLGYDMRSHVNEHGVPKTHWFGDYPGKTSPDVYNQMLPHFDSLPAPLKARGVEVINCTPGSALKTFRRGAIEAELERQAA